MAWLVTLLSTLRRTLRFAPELPYRSRTWPSGTSWGSIVGIVGALAYGLVTASSGRGSHVSGRIGAMHSWSFSPRRSSHGVIAWRRRKFREYWRSLSRSGKPGRPAVPREVRDLIRRMSSANPLWGSPHVVGELKKIGITRSGSTVAKYMVRRRKPPSQTWRSFLKNQIADIAAVDFFIVPTVKKQILFVLLIFAHERRRVFHFNITKARQLSGLLNRSWRHSRGTARRATSCVIGTRSTLHSSSAGSKTWASSKWSPHHEVPGRIHSSSD